MNWLTWSDKTTLFGVQIGDLIPPGYSVHSASALWPSETWLRAPDGSHRRVETGSYYQVEWREHTRAAFSAWIIRYVEDWVG